MSTPNFELNLTPVQTEAAPKALPPRFNPVRLFVDMNLAARFWFALFLIHVALTHLPALFAQRQPEEKVIVLDGAGTVIQARLLRFRDARALHLQQAALATYAFLNRTPLDFDSPELLELIYLRDAAAKARALFAQEAGERTAKQIHQKVEIASIDLLETRDEFILSEVTGQIIRAGVFQDRPFAEGVPFRLALKMLRNPDMSQNGRFPTAVKDFRYENTH